MYTSATIMEKYLNHRSRRRILYEYYIENKNSTSRTNPKSGVFLIKTFFIGGGAGNRTPVRQGPTLCFSVRSPCFSVETGLPGTGFLFPSFLYLSW